VLLPQVSCPALTMWFKRTPRNRRLGREHVLDVRLRSSQVRAARARMAAVAISVVFTVVLGAYLCWRGGEWTLNRLVYENRAFAIDQIDVQTDGVIALDQLRRWTGVRPGQNLLALDLAKLKRDLEMVSVIYSASVERILPHTLRVRVVEREPLAQVIVPRPRADGGVELAVFNLDANGCVIVPLEARQRATPLAQPGEPLPVIGGLNGNEIQAGRRIESPQVRGALQLLQAFERSPMEGLVDLKRIDVSAPEVLVVTTGQGSEITFGLTDLDRQLRRWHQIVELGQRMNKALGSLDLAITNNIPARWLEDGAVPAGTPKTPKPPHPRKNNV
jgi:cell division protein FtsQ